MSTPGTTALGLSAAAAWGAGDFTGGVASRRAHVFAVLVAAHASGIVLLSALALLVSEPAPARAPRHRALAARGCALLVDALRPLGLPGRAHEAAAARPTQPGPRAPLRAARLERQRALRPRHPRGAPRCGERARLALPREHGGAGAAGVARAPQPHAARGYGRDASRHPADRGLTAAAYSSSCARCCILARIRSPSVPRPLPAGLFARW